MHVIEKRVFNLLQHIMFKDNVHLDQLQANLNCTERQVLYDLQKLNAVLAERGMDAIKINRRRLLIPEGLKEEIANMDLEVGNAFVYGDIKMWLIGIMIFCATKPLSIAHFIALFKNSKTTILSDLKKLNALANRYKVSLAYTRGKGYHFVGEAREIRTFILFSIASIKENYLCKKLIAVTLEKPNFVGDCDRVEKRIECFVEKYKIPVIKAYLDQTVYFLVLLKYHVRSLFYQETFFHEKRWEGISLYQKTSAVFDDLDLPNHEKGYVFILLMTMSMGSMDYFDAYEKESLFLRSLACELADRFEIITGMKLAEPERVRENILFHLQPALMRLTYGIPIVNPILDQIKKDHGSFFSICKLVLEPLSKYVDTYIPEDEIAYIVIHFLAMLETEASVREKNRAIIVCQNGIASSIMLKNQLVTLFPEFSLMQTYNIEEFKQLHGDAYDIIFSTCPISLIPRGKFFFQVSAVMTTPERFRLMEDVYATVFGLKKEVITVNDIMDVVSQYATIKEPIQLTQALHALMNKKYKINRKEVVPVLKDLFTQETIQFAKSVADWEEAIQVAAKPLLKRGAITEKYVQAMIDNVKNLGPYIVICPNIAIPHAQCKGEVLEVGMSFLKLEEEVFFGDKPVSVLIVLAAVDNDSHLKALAELAELLCEDDTRDELLQAKDVADVLKLIG